MCSGISPSVILPGRVTKTGLSHRALYAPPHPLVRFFRKHDLASAAVAFCFAAVVVFTLAVVLQHIEVRYNEHRIPTTELDRSIPATNVEGNGIVLPPEKMHIQLTGIFGRPAIALAAEKKDIWAAEHTSQTATVVRMDPGRSLTLEVQFKNTGTTTWRKTGDHFVALNVANPAGRTSPFRHPFWKEYSYRPTRLLEDSVAPGKIGTFRFAVQAPQAPGRFQEDFAVVAEDLLWISGGEAHFTMVVNNPYKAKLQSGNNRNIAVEPGKALTLEARFKNIGTATWTRNEGTYAALNVTNPAGRTSVFRHAFWNEYPYRTTRLLEDHVAPGETGTFRFAIQAPVIAGNYKESFGLVAENYAWMNGGTVTYTFQVGTIAGETDVAEPRIRVGLMNTTDPVTITAIDAMDVYAGTKKIGSVATGKTLTIAPVGSNAHVTADGIDVNSAEPIRAVPQNEQIITVTSYNVRPGWNPDLNFNAFRGVIEVRWSTRDEKFWVINELPMEQYMAGIAETSNGNPPEYLKSLTTAARSYAYYHYNRGVQILHTTLESTKHGDRGFHVHTTYDQVYRGYNFERVAYDIVASVRDTRGLVVAYNGEPVVTPYYSHSDGRTRAWTEVWYGGPYPWLVSVADPCCTNMPLFGHGVGMSALGAIWFANNKSWTAEQILSYYYQGTTLKELY